MRRLGFRGASRGFTLIELMIVIALMAILIALSVPSFRNMIEMQRLRGIHGELVTDLQFARSEAAARGRYVRVNFGFSSDSTCYSIFTADQNSLRCNCLLDSALRCPAGTQEIKTVHVAKSNSVRFAMEPLVAGGPDQDSAFAFDYRSGGLVTSSFDLGNVPLPAVQIDTIVDAKRTLRTVLIQSGRPSVCAPSASTMQVSAC